MVKVNDWVQRTVSPLPGKEPFDWYPWSIAQVAQVNDEGVHVLFACKCMTHDQSDTKFWYNGEYEPLDMKTVHEKLDQHSLHCIFDSKVSTYAVGSSSTIHVSTTEEYKWSLAEAKRGVKNAIRLMLLDKEYVYTVGKSLLWRISLLSTR